MLLLGDKIHQERIIKNLSIAELSRKAGIDGTEISFLEKHQTKFINLKSFQKLSQIIDLEGYEHYVFQGTGELLGKKLKHARISMGYTQEKLAEIAQFSSPTNLCRLEQGHCSKISEENFLKLQPVLFLNREEFEPFIQNKRKVTSNQRNITINLELIQKLVLEKKEQLHLSRVGLERKSKVSIKTIKQIEEGVNRKYSEHKLLQIMHALCFSEEEITECFLGLKESLESQDISKKCEKVKKKI